ncbi:MULTISPECIES: dephospho-CoA kinase [unclassified Rhodococcus (in: high G+C Gram-positive bacteria)]|uniref:dephospho-CoA kinase n=1 Tax=unclassified Rhodococcus (in: high G+C Gram-positive bacteria) TaxID=192944 RepID=UPI003211DEE7
MLRMGLTGGIGAGKSTVAKELVNLGAVLVDADAIAREIVEPGSEGLAELVDAFGEDILRPDGSLDRPALAAKAFATDDARAVLNAITHPRVGARTAELVAAAPEDAVVVQDIPLLVEGGMAPIFHLVAVVHAGEDERLRRLVELRGMPESDARARIAAQATEEQRRVVADVWLDNTGEPDDVVSRVRGLWADRLVPFERNVRTRTAVTAAPVLVPARPEWDRSAQRLIARLAVACGGSALRIDHVGSTAVPGLDAVDALDLQVTVPDLAAADALAEPLAVAGFPRIEQVDHDQPKPSYGAGGETDPALWAMRLHGSADPGQPARVAVRVDGWPGQQFALLLRDWLRADAEAAAEYADVKRAAADAASAFGDPLESAVAYSEAKSPWFDRAYHRAWAWAQDTGWSA